jgi:cutinase
MNVIELIEAKCASRLRASGSARQIGRFLGAVVVTTWVALLGAPVPSASAQPCPDVEVVFARGSTEPPGVGMVGQAFIDALRPQLGSRSLGVYPVNYAAALPAGSDFADRLAFAKTFVDGLRDEGAHVESMAANCPNTRQVLGGYSQGAALTGFVTSPVIPKDVPTQYVSYLPKPMPPEIANHVAAVVLFGKPSDLWMRENGALPVTIGPLYAPKTIELCAPDDNICNGAPEVQPTIAHVMYAVNGMTEQGADFAASHL